MISTLKAALENEYDAVVINYRGLAGVPLKVTKHLELFSSID
jgi:hypothetical protein